MLPVGTSRAVKRWGKHSEAERANIPNPLLIVVVGKLMRAIIHGSHFVAVLASMWTVCTVRVVRLWSKHSEAERVNILSPLLFEDGAIFLCAKPDKEGSIT
jgi:hypothetical protein